MSGRSLTAGYFGAQLFIFEITVRDVFVCAGLDVILRFTMLDVLFKDVLWHLQHSVGV